MMKKIFIYLSTISLLLSIEFETKIGKCNLNFDNKDNKNAKEYMSFIQKDIENLVFIFGEVKIAPFEIYITNNMDSFKKLAKGPTPEWGVGIAKKNPSRIVVKGTQLGKITYNRLNEVLRHELNHIYIFRTPNYNILPKWFVEGFASFWADELTITKKIQISSALWEKRQFALKGLKSFQSFHRIHANLAYAQSNVAILVILHYYGEASLKNMIHSKDNVDSFDFLFEKITGDTPLELTYKYENYLNQNFKWMFLLKSSNILFISLPIILVIGFFVRRHKNRLILEKWEKEEQLEYDEVDENN